jgi:N utilization substance protein B
MTNFFMAKQNNKSSKKARNSAARLLGVQAVYQMHKNDQTADAVIKELLEFRAGKDYEGDGDVMVAPNEDHFTLLVRGVNEHIDQLGEMVAKNRTLKEGALPKNEPLLQAILLCGAFELMVLQSIDAPIIISDYLHVTRAFFEDPEAKLVNAVLDSIRATVRD